MVHSGRQPIHVEHTKPRPIGARHSVNERCGHRGVVQLLDGHLQTHLVHFGSAQLHHQVAVVFWAKCDAIPRIIAIRQLVILAATGRAAFPFATDLPRCRILVGQLTQLEGITTVGTERVVNGGGFLVLRHHERVTAQKKIGNCVEEEPYYFLFLSTYFLPALGSSLILHR